MRENLCLFSKLIEICGDSEANGLWVKTVKTPIDTNSRDVFFLENPVVFAMFSHGNAWFSCVFSLSSSVHRSSGWTQSGASHRSVCCRCALALVEVRWVDFLGTSLFRLFFFVLKCVKFSTFVHTSENSFGFEGAGFVFMEIWARFGF